MKTCPYCAEAIQANAIKCKHCGEWLKPSERIRVGATAFGDWLRENGPKISKKVGENIVKGAKVAKKGAVASGEWVKENTPKAKEKAKAVQDRIQAKFGEKKTSDKRPEHNGATSHPGSSNMDSKICPSCQVKNNPTFDFCWKCRADLNKEPTDTSNSNTYQRAKSIKRRNPAAAVCLNLLFPGLGQFYNRQFLKGFAFLVGFFITMKFTYPFLFVYFAAIADAAYTAVQYNKNLVDVLEYVRRQASEILSEEWEQRTPALVAARNKKSLGAIDMVLFTQHLQAMTIELLRIVVSRHKVSLDRRVEVSLELDKLYKKHYREDVKQLVSSYNEAFGSSSADGIAVMAKLAGESLAAEQADAKKIEAYIYDVLYRVLNSMLAATASISLR